MRAWRQAAVIAAPIVAVISICAQATLGALPDPARAAFAAVVESPAPAATTAAQPIADTGIASPAAGTTGTVELPPVPLQASDIVLPAGGATTAAQPFSMARASTADRGRALQCLTAAIYYEAASESDDGQRAVAQVVLNRVRHATFPATVCGVVYQGSERYSGCQFSFACDGAMARTPSRNGWARAMRHAAAALTGHVHASVGLATHYHTYAVTPSWNRTLVMTDAIGAHFFHRWKGYWGTAGAFGQAYRGGEPFPGPHPRPVRAPTTPGIVDPAAVALIAAAGAAAAAQTPVTPIAQVQPAHADSGTPVDPARESVADAQILDRWKDSGKPIN